MDQKYINESLDAIYREARETFISEYARARRQGRPTSWIEEHVCAWISGQRRNLESVFVAGLAFGTTGEKSREEIREIARALNAHRELDTTPPPADAIIVDAKE